MASIPRSTRMEKGFYANITAGKKVMLNKLFYNCVRNCFYTQSCHANSWRGRNTDIGKFKTAVSTIVRTFWANPATLMAPCSIEHKRCDQPTISTIMSTFVEHMLTGHTISSRGEIGLLTTNTGC